MWAIPKELKSSLIFKTLAVFVVLILAFAFFSSRVPFNSCEFIPYSALSLHFSPLNSLQRNAFSDMYYLAPFSNIFLPLRTYYHMGLVHSALYFPLFALWPSPYSARLVGLAMLILQAFLVYKIFKLDFLASFLLLLFFMPYAFQNIADTGPVSFQLTSIFFIFYLTQKWMASLEKNEKRGWAYPLAIGIVIFLGIWAKLAYFFVLPAVSCLVFYQIAVSRKIFAFFPKPKILIRHLAILLAAAAIPSFVLLNSKQLDSHKYFELITGSEKLNPFDIATWLGQAKLMARFLVYPLKAAHLIFDTNVNVRPEGFLWCSALAALFITGIVILRKRKEQLGFIIVNVFLFLLTFFLMTLSRRAWAMHHVVLAYPFLLLAFFSIYSKLSGGKIIRTLAIAFVAVNIGLYAHLTRLSHHDFASPAMVKINAVVNKRFADRYVCVVLEGYVYDMKVLYGNKNQCVLFLEPRFKDSEIENLKGIMARLDRKALFVDVAGSESSLPRLKKDFPGLIRLETDFGQGMWQIWYEK